MAQPFRLGIAGLGTVGCGVIDIIQKHAEMLTARAGRPIEITAVSARTKDRKRPVDISKYIWEDEPLALAGREDVDAVLELIGGSEGSAYDLVKAALSNGKSVVTANKAMMAHHGYELAMLAETNGVSLAYEASVAGCVPIIKSLREGFAGNEITGVYGILNGTCNYMLTKMRETGRDFDVILKEAQELGYAEADPTFDVDGIDAAHKLAILAALGFGVRPNFDALSIEGIRKINSTDIAFASELGYRIKLLGIARRMNGKFMQVMAPALVPVTNPMGVIEDVYNAVFVEGDSIETPFMSGRGAGAGPTASAVMADVIDLAWGIKVPTFGVPAPQLKEAKWAEVGETISKYYIRLQVLDQPGVIADVSAILRDQHISIEGLLQRGRDPGQPVPIVLTTHESKHADIVKACELFAGLKAVVDEPCLIRIEDLE